MDWPTLAACPLSIGWRMRDVATMIDQVVGDKLIPANIRQDIIQLEHTDGIPCSWRNDQGGAGGRERTKRGALRPLFRPLHWPFPAHASLTARLDRLGAPPKR